LNKNHYSSSNVGADGDEELPVSQASQEDDDDDPARVEDDAASATEEEDWEEDNERSTVFVFPIPRSHSCSPNAACRYMEDPMFA
jgi:hypothetical protein